MEGGWVGVVGAGGRADGILDLFERAIDVGLIDEGALFERAIEAGFIDDL